MHFALYVKKEFFLKENFYQIFLSRRFAINISQKIKRIERKYF